MLSELSSHHAQSWSCPVSATCSKSLQGFSSPYKHSPSSIVAIGLKLSASSSVHPGIVSIHEPSSSVAFSL